MSNQQKRPKLPSLDDLTKPTNPVPVHHPRIGLRQQRKIQKVLAIDDHSIVGMWKPDMINVILGNITGKEAQRIRREVAAFSDIEF